LSAQTDTTAFLVPEDRGRALQALQEALSGKPEVSMELVAVDKDGQKKKVAIRAFPIVENGVCTGTRGFVTDVTERKNAEISLKKSEEKFRVIVDMCKEWIWAIDTNLNHIYSNQAIEAILGYSPEEIVGSDCISLIHEGDRRMVEETVKEKIASKEGWSDFVVRWRHRDGGYRFLESNAVPIFDNEKRLVGFQGVDRDITERRRVEEALRNAQKLEALGVLAGGVAHDFNNLLTGIFGFVELARIATSRESAFEHLGEAAKTINRAQNLTQQLLTFAKGGEPSKAVAALPALIKDTANFVLSGSNVGPVFFIPDDLWPGNVDENQFAQALDNIILNARQAMPRGGTIEIKAENVRKGSALPPPLHPNDYVCISIRDHGTSIAEEHLQRIFDPFFTTKRGGTGLGLAIVHSIVKKHGGHIEVESKKGEGSTFKIWIPASLTSSLPQGQKKRFVPQRTGRILLMDDQKVVLNATGQLLKRMGYTVECASDGREAIELYKKAKESACAFDAVILDLTVPDGMGGRDTLCELLKIDPNVRAVASSGYSNDSIMSDPQAFGFRAKLPKPYTVSEISEAIDKLMGK
jgi:PAS domain S-box-containing protein